MRFCTATRRHPAWTGAALVTTKIFVARFQRVTTVEPAGAPKTRTRSNDCDNGRVSSQPLPNSKQTGLCEVTQERVEGLRAYEARGFTVIALGRLSKRA